MSERAAREAASRQLRRKIELVLPALLSAGRDLLHHPRAAELYPEYLITMHAVIRSSVPLMEAGVREARRIGDHDRVASGVAAYLDRHIEEELHHDEWLLEDLQALGVDRDEALRRPPSPTVAALAGSQYYWVLHYHPVALLGYISLLEGYPPAPAEIEGLIRSTGHPRAAFRTLLLHADLDPGHRDELDATIDALPLTDEQATALGLSAISSVHLLAEAIREVVEDGGASR